MGKTNIDDVKLGGARRKNGHKVDCTCHICENMKKKASRGGYTEEIEKQEENISGGLKKKNGHRKDCKCPICKNMNNAKKGGNSFEKKHEKKEIEKQAKNISGGNNFEKEQEEEEIDYDGGKKRKSNGHKSNCKCPICKNIRKSKKGGDDPDEENQINVVNSDMDTENETKATDAEYDTLDATQKSEDVTNVVGGTRKQKKLTGKTKRNRRTRKRRINRSRKHH